VLLQTERLKVVAKLTLGAVLSQEMLNFRVKIDPITAHDSYSAWREEDHDDLVLSVALAAWCGEKGPKGAVLVRPGVVRRRSKWWRWQAELYRDNLSC
jgi:hypothetical protein